MAMFDMIMDLTPANRENYEALVEAVMNNTAVPFVGAGLSVPYYPGWGSTLEQLKDKYVAPDRVEAVEKVFESAATEIEKCGVLEDAIGGKRLCRALCEMFDLSHFTEKGGVDSVRDKAAALLPRLFPDVPLLTTNLDRMQEEVFRDLGAPFVEKLSPADKGILDAQRQGRYHGILYLHGCASEELTDYEQLVFSQRQYDEHYKKGSELVTALKGWMGNAKLLFLGCSLRNDRTLELLGRLYGKHPRLEHFAILSWKPQEDGGITGRMQQLEKDYGIRAILYPDGQHDAVRVLLARLLHDVNYDAWQTYCGTLPAPALDAKATDPRRFTPEAANTDFCGRDGEMKKLRDFCLSPEEFRWWAVTAPGGSGKTRLLRELAEEMQQENWAVMWVGQSEYTDITYEKLGQTRHNLLILSDYAGEHVKPLTDWIDRLSALEGKGGPKRRLLLAEREAATNRPGAEDMGSAAASLVRNTWYDRMKAPDMAHGNLDTLQYGRPGEFLPLEPLAEKSLREVMRSYAAKVHHRELTDGEAGDLYAALEKIDPGLCRPLYAMFIADAFVENGDVRKWDRDQVLGTLLEREKRHLVGRQMEFFGCQNEKKRLMNAVEKLRLYATVHGGASVGETGAWPLIREAAEREDRSPVDFLQFLQLTADDSSDDDGEALRVDPVRPDLLGEYYVVTELRRALPLLFAPGWMMDGPRGAFLARLVQDYAPALPQPFWDTLLSASPETEEEADGLMDRLFPATCFADPARRTQAADRMGQIFAAFPTRPVAYTYAVGLFNLTVANAKAGDVDKCHNAVDTLRDVWEVFGNEQKIAHAYARGLMNLTAAQKTPEARRITVNEIHSVWKEFYSDCEIALVYAKGLFNLSNVQKTSEARRRIVDTLRCVWGVFETDQEIALTYAKGLVNLAAAQGKAGNEADCHKTVAALLGVWEAFETDREIALVYAKGLMNLTVVQAKAVNEAECQNTVMQLSELQNREAFKTDRDIALEYAQGLINLAVTQDRGGNMSDCSTTVQTLRRVTAAYPSDPDFAKLERKADYIPCIIDGR